MINFRKLKQEYAPASLKEGKVLIDEKRVKEVRLASINEKSVRIQAKVDSPYATSYRCELEIDLRTSGVSDSDCDCPHKYDCHHLAALIFHLENNLDEMVIEFDAQNSKKKDSAKKSPHLDEKTNWAKERVHKKQGKETLDEVITAARILGESPFCALEAAQKIASADLLLLFKEGKKIEVQIALRLEGRIKPIVLPNVADFFEAVKGEFPFCIGGKSLFLSKESFCGVDRVILETLLQSLEYKMGERLQKVAFIEPEDFGELLATIYDQTISLRHNLESLPYEVMPSLFLGGFDEPLKCSVKRAALHFSVEMVKGRVAKAIIRPKVVLEQDLVVDPAEVSFFEGSRPGLIHHNLYFRFDEAIRRRHLKGLADFEELVVPEPLFGTLFENSLPAFEKLGRVVVDAELNRFVTLPYVKPLKGECQLVYEGEELEAKLFFDYGDIKVPASFRDLDLETCLSFVTEEGIRARNIAEEQMIIKNLFADFIFDAHRGLFVAKNDKKIIEFMTATIPENGERIHFIVPEKLKRRFVYDTTSFKLNLKESARIDTFIVELKTEGDLKGVSLDTLWDCLLSSRNFIELDKISKEKLPKILVLDLKKLEPIVHVFDEIGVHSLSDHQEERPLFHLASLRKSLFKGLPIAFSMTDKLAALQERLMAESFPEATPIPEAITTTLRPYQICGVEWLEKLRFLHLGGILADDMGLGKTLQTICALSQYKNESGNKISLVIAPTSLLFNWQEEVMKFNPTLRVEVLSGLPEERKQKIEASSGVDLFITSYSLAQRDIEWLEKQSFGYVILDEAQHIKNRATRNARTVKQIKADHRLILTGTPIENSLEELWSLFDFLMPGFLSSYDRFLEKYVKNPLKDRKETIELLKVRVAPFILRRMKRDVLKELPEASELFYHCRLSPLQEELYRNFAAHAKKELNELVEKQGFEKSHMQILATLTRLKQICCHPALFAKDTVDRGDSAKYEMFLDLLEGLIEGGHRTVVFSQYTKMLEIMRRDLESKSIPFEYLDGTTKNRLAIVKKFNEDENIPVFLVSLKAGGTGLNLVGADTVIQYDLAWNPAVENQAKDRVHRIGQKNAVSCFRLITLDTIEEKILALQNRKMKLATDVISSDEELVHKLTLEEAFALIT